ncbi:unnamed protein product [Lactuca saligna]|uniref:Uncharacterized protein n=1 Tax=Lactuca saligna TaxID=75948 RepID=A0AA36DWD6_LACSI|nr:unnamed protein product [Lactuca saligna]
MANVIWTADEDKIFESALVRNKDAENKWELIAELLPGKTAEEVKVRRETLLMNAVTTWTTEEDKLLESALKNVPEGTPGRLHEVAKAVPGRTMEEVRVHSELLMMDVNVDLNEIDYDRVELPNHDKESAREGSQKKRKPWTSEEHRKFLEGVKEFGKGEWKSISRKSVITRTPEQIGVAATQEEAAEGKNDGILAMSRELL